MEKLLSVYKKLSNPVKASLWFTISSIIEKGIALISTPIFTRILSTEEYGMYSVYQSWYSVVLIFTTLNLYAGVYNNGLTKWPEQRKKYTSALQGLSTTITIIWFIIYMLGMDFWNKLLGLSSLFILAMFIQALFIPAFNFWASEQRYDYKYKKLVIISLIIGISSPLLGIIAVISSSYKVEARVLSFALIQVCVGLIFYIYNYRKGKCFYNRSYWKFALLFNLPLIPHYLAQIVLGQADRIMIAKMVGKEEAAIYSVAYTISMMFTIVTNAINTTFIPYTYKAMKDKEYKNLKNNTSFLVLLVGSACIVAMAFGPEIIKIFAAPEYYEARWIIPPVAESLFFMFIFPLFCNIEFYFEKTKFIMIASGVAAVTNIILNIIMIPKFGYIAAAYTTLICYIFLSVIHYIAYRRICHIEGLFIQLYNIKFIACLGIVSILVMIFMAILYDVLVIRYVIIFIISLVIFIKRGTVINKFKELKDK